MSISIDANATFNPVGDIRPRFIRLEDDNHELHTYKIENVNSIKEEHYLGIHSILFNCSIKVEEVMKTIDIRYHFESHKWSLVEKKTR